MGRAKKKSATDQWLEKEYYNPKAPESYGAQAGLHRHAKQARQKPISLPKIKQWLSMQDTYTLHKPVRRKFRRRRVVVGGIDHQWQADLVDVSRIKHQNRGYTFLLTCLDVLSKFAWVVPIKNKTGASLVQAFKIILKSGRKPLRLQTDKGLEFTNQTFLKLLKDHQIEFFTTENEDIKASIVERFNRTLKTKMWKYFTRHNTLKYVDVLSDLVDSYNHSYHHSIKTKPALVDTHNQEEVWQRLYGQKQDTSGDAPSPDFAPGNVVRISKAKRTFKKGYLPNWSEELFTVISQHPGDPPVYRIRDDRGEVLKGTFYAWELQKVQAKKVYRIETILEERKKGKTPQVLVKWQGYPASFNSWINKRDLRLYKG